MRKGVLIDTKTSKKISSSYIYMKETLFFFVMYSYILLFFKGKWSERFKVRGVVSIDKNNLTALKMGLETDM